MVRNLLVQFESVSKGALMFHTGVLKLLWEALGALQRAPGSVRRAPGALPEVVGPPLEVLGPSDVVIPRRQAWAARLRRLCAIQTGGVPRKRCFQDFFGREAWIREYWVPCARKYPLESGSYHDECMLHIDS
eukprot:5318750-Pyramimonas_sp.AAC.1